jgi:hypothetical protein
MVKEPQRKDKKNLAKNINKLLMCNFLFNQEFLFEQDFTK